MIIETVNSTNNKFEFYKTCKDKKYKITLVYVCTSDYKINIERVNKRKSEGGHNVAEDKIISRYHKSLENLVNLSLLSDVLYIFDTSKNGKVNLCVYKDDKSLYKAKMIPEWIEKYYFERLNKYE